MNFTNYYHICSKNVNNNCKFSHLVEVPFLFTLATCDCCAYGAMVRKALDQSSNYLIFQIVNDHSKMYKHLII